MLIPPDVINKCLRCRAELAPADDTCRACGADPALERQIWVQETAAVRELRWVFLVALGLDAFVSWLVYDHLHRFGIDTTAIVVSGAIVCGTMAALWLLAPRAPMVASGVGLAIFGADWVREIVRDRVYALEPGAGMALRIAIMSALVFAMRRGLAARKLRAQRREAPRAIAITTAAPTA